MTIKKGKKSFSTKVQVDQKTYLCTWWL